MSNDYILSLRTSQAEKKAITQFMNPKLNILSDTDMIRGLIQKDRTAYEALYAKYAASLFGVILKIVPDQKAAEEILQDTFFEINYRCSSYDASKGRFFNWIINIARNLALRKSKLEALDKSLLFQLIERSTETQPLHPADVEAPDARSIPDNADKQGMLILDMIYFKGYTCTEVSEIVKAPAETVKALLRKTILSLRKRL